MAGAFAELDWRRLDVWAVIEHRGVHELTEEKRVASLSWLKAESYEVVTLDFSNGISPVVKQLGELFKWPEQFGYELSADSRNLDALRDGFDVPFTDAGRFALELVQFERARAEDSHWATGFLEIVSEMSLRELALGRRLFAMIGVL